MAGIVPTFILLLWVVIAVEEEDATVRSTAVGSNDTILSQPRLAILEQLIVHPGSFDHGVVTKTTRRPHMSIDKEAIGVASGENEDGVPPLVVAVVVRSRKGFRVVRNVRAVNCEADITDATTRRELLPYLLHLLWRWRRPGHVGGLQHLNHCGREEV